jgi:hypothetical protein
MRIDDPQAPVPKVDKLNGGANPDQLRSETREIFVPQERNTENPFIGGLLYGNDCMLE